MGNLKAKQLLVEGDEDRRVIPNLIEANGVRWGESQGEAIVNIKSSGGIENLLKPGLIETELKATGLEALGIVLDANAEGASRWRRVHERCRAAYPDLPDDLPSEGLIYKRRDRPQLGIWIMPDNRLAGMLETFLASLVPQPELDLWSYTLEAVEEARQRGASLRDSHLDKARIHTWLAWQDPPGDPLHIAILKRTLKPDHPSAAGSFVSWFRRLFTV